MTTQRAETRGAGQRALGAMLPPSPSGNVLTSENVMACHMDKLPFSLQPERVKRALCRTLADEASLKC